MIKALALSCIVLLPHMGGLCHVNYAPPHFILFETGYPKFNIKFCVSDILRKSVFVFDKPVNLGDTLLRQESFALLIQEEYLMSSNHLLRSNYALICREKVIWTHEDARFSSVFPAPSSINGQNFCWILTSILPNWRERISRLVFAPSCMFAATHWMRVVVVETHPSPLGFNHSHRGFIGLTSQGKSDREHESTDGDQYCGIERVIPHVARSGINRLCGRVHFLLDDKVIYLPLAGFLFAILAGLGGGLILDDFNRDRNRKCLGWLLISFSFPSGAACLFLGLP